MQKALSAEKSLQGANFSAQVRAALRSGQKLDASTTETTGAPAPISVAKAEALEQKKLGPDPVILLPSLILELCSVFTPCKFCLEIFVVCRLQNFYQMIKCNVNVFK